MEHQSWQEERVDSKLRTNFPSLKSIHCLAHKLELAVHNACKSVTGCNNLEIFHSKLYTFYLQKMPDCSMMLPLMLTYHCWRLGRFSPFAGLPSVSTLWELFGRTFLHLPHKCRMLLWMWIGHYWGNSAAHVLLKTLHWWKMCSELQTAKSKHIFKWWQLVDSSDYGGPGGHENNTRKGHKGEYQKGADLQTVIDNISVRFPDSELTELLTPLKPSCWPKDCNSLVLYGEKEIHDLAKHLGVPTRAAVEKYRLWKLESESWEDDQEADYC